jgi:hypothetical protein
VRPTKNDKVIKLLDMNKYLRLIIISLTIILQSCLSGTPDCDDVDKQELKWDLNSYEQNMFFKEKLKLLDSLKSYWKEKGYKEISLYDQYSRGIELDRMDSIKNDSIGRLWSLSEARLDTLWISKKRTIEKAISNLKFVDEVKFIRESENSSLTKFHCHCYVQFEIDGENGVLRYKLTRKDWDSRTYQNVTSSTLKYDLMTSNKDWEYLIQ